MRASDQEDLDMCSKLIEHLYCVLVQVHNIWIIRIVDCMCDAFQKWSTELAKEESKYPESLAVPPAVVK